MQLKLNLDLIQEMSHFISADVLPLYVHQRKVVLMFPLPNPLGEKRAAANEIYHQGLKVCTQTVAVSLYVVYVQLFMWGQPRAEQRHRSVH